MKFVFLFHFIYAFNIPALWDLKFLPGFEDVWFPVNGLPDWLTSSNLDDIKFYTNFMLENNLGNGYHCGPAFQASLEAWKYLADTPGVLGNIVWQAGPSVSDLDEKLALFDSAKKLYGLHIGEWGHDWRCQNHTNCDIGIFGLHRCCGHWPATPNDTVLIYQFDPPPIHPDYFPQNRIEAHDMIKKWVQDTYVNPGKAYGGYISFSGYAHYSQYGARWGLKCSGIELGENIWYTQTKMMWTRSGARATNVPFCIDISAWFGGGNPKAGNYNDTSFHYGHSHSFLYRVWAYSWFAGAAELYAEAGSEYFTWNFDQTSSVPFSEQNITLTSIGKMAQKMMNLFKNHDRGVTYTPLSLIVDYYLGYGGSTQAPFHQQHWGYFKSTPEEFALYEFFETQLLRLDHPYEKSHIFPRYQEQLQLRATMFGDLADVHLSDVNETVLGAYPMLVLVAQIDFNRFGFMDSLIAAAKGKNNLEKILIPSYMVASISTDDMTKLNQTGIVEVTNPWINPQTNHRSFISNERLAQIEALYMPVEVSSTFPIQYSINKNAKGWVVYIANNLGILKEPLEVPTVDDFYTTDVTITPKATINVTGANEWLSGRVMSKPPYHLTLEPGEFAFLEIL